MNDSQRDDKQPAPSHRLANAAVLGGALLVALAAVYRYTHVLPGSGASFQLERERCYGIARAGQNDCGTAQHSCAGRSTHDRAADEWISLPAGTCARIAGAQLKEPGS